MTVEEFKICTRGYEKKLVKLYKGRWVRYHKIYCGFDIETTTVNDKSFMWVWQLGFKTDTLPQVVVKGRTWQEFDSLISFLKKRFGLRENTRLIIWIANLSFEFQFIKHRMGFIDELFAKSTYNPLLVRFGGIEFRDALPISQGGLAYLAKTWTTTQKAVGELDYTKMRNSLTPIDPTGETTYIDNDVIILSEFSEKIFADYIEKERYIPLTSTGILRHDLKKAAKASVKNPERIYNWIQSLYPKTKADYLYIMEWLFRGGYVHACYQKTGYVLENYDSFDKKSSYPASAFQCYYPIKAFREVRCETEEDLQELCRDWCVIFTVTFYNVKSTTAHSIESRSKCIYLSEEKLLDNGRVRECDYMTVMLTELDYETYKEFYTWDKAKTKIHRVEIAQRGSLPKYLLDRFYHWFAVKESIDQHEDPQGYAISKTRINGHFGMCVTRLCFEDVFYDEHTAEWNYKEVEKTYDKLIEGSVLSPFFGIYITAHSRRDELSMLYKMREEVAYSDTDSHKLQITPNVLEVINTRNNDIRALNEAICAKYGYDIAVLGKIGMWEHETAPEEKGKMLRFKTMGAKRYITEYANKGFESTVSGLKKGALKKYADHLKKDPFDLFENGLKIPEEYTEKLTPIYCEERTAEEVTDEYGNTEIMRERSSVYLKPVTFELTLDKDYLKLINFWLERTIRHAN